MNKQLDIYGQSAIVVPRTEGIKYAGSKLKLLGYILSIIEQLDDISTIFDGFSGTTRVSQALAQLGYSVTASDTAIWSEVFGNCYLKSNKPDSYYQEIINHLNKLPGKNGWYSQHYGGKPTELTPKRPFQLKNTQKLDSIRDEIDKLGLEWADKCVILTSLTLALDSVDNTLGHYVSYLSKWSPRSYNDMVLRLPKRFPNTSQHQVIRGDIFDTATVEHFDLAYLDPPYGSNNEKMPPSRVRYASYYHIWKTVILNDKPELFGKVNRRQDSRDLTSGSIFENYRKDTNGKFVALDALDRLIRETDAHYILLSYSSSGRATKRELQSIINNSGKLLNVTEIDYKRNVMADMRWTHKWVPDETKNTEYLFLIDKVDSRKIAAPAHRHSQRLAASRAL